MPNYPASLDTNITIPAAVDNVTPISGDVYNRLRSAVIALEQELGVKPSGVYSTVKARLDSIDSIISAYSITTHNNLPGLQGGSGADGYYHLTATQANWLIDGYNDGYWQTSKGGTGIPTYTAGDLLYASSSTVLSKLSASSDGYVLTLSSSLPAWASIASIFAYNVQSKTTTYTAQYGDLIKADSIGGGFTITLPTAVGASGKQIIIKKISSDGNTITINTTSSQTIDGSTSLSITAQYTSLIVVSDNANWYIV